MRKPKTEKGQKPPITMLSFFGAMSDAVAKGADVARAMTAEDDGSPVGERRTRAAERSGKEKTVRPRNEAASKKAAGDGVKGTRKGRGDAGSRQTVQTYVRLPEAMLKAVEKAVEDSPIEFGSASEFIRRAVETELRRRGLLANFK